LRAGAADLVAGAGDDLRVVVFFLDALMTMGGYGSPNEAKRSRSEANAPAAERRIYRTVTFRSESKAGQARRLQAKTSSGRKKRAISATPFSTLSEAWTTLIIMSVPKSPRRVPLAALRESVGPSRSRTR